MMAALRSPIWVFQVAPTIASASVRLQTQVSASSMESNFFLFIYTYLDEREGAFIWWVPCDIGGVGDPSDVF
jgi:hypothetical protein